MVFWLRFDVWNPRVQFYLRKSSWELAISSISQDSMTAALEVSKENRSHIKNVSTITRNCVEETYLLWLVFIEMPIEFFVIIDRKLFIIVIWTLHCTCYCQIMILVCILGYSTLNPELFNQSVLHYDDFPPIWCKTKPKNSHNLGLKICLWSYL